MSLNEPENWERGYRSDEHEASGGLLEATGWEAKSKEPKAKSQKLFLKQAPGSKGSDRREQPLDPPQLDCLPVEYGPGAKEHVNRQSSHHAECANQKSDDGRRREPEPLTERREFSQTREFQRARNTNAQIGTAS